MLQPVSQLSEDVLDCDCLALVTYMFLHGRQGTSFEVPKVTIVLDYSLQTIVIDYSPRCSVEGK